MKLTILLTEIRRRAAKRLGCRADQVDVDLIRKERQYLASAGSPTEYVQCVMPAKGRGVEDAILGLLMLLSGKGAA